MMNLQNTYRFIMILLITGAVVMMQSGCVKHHTDEVHVNRTPNTYFWVYSDTAVAQGISKQEIRWWGEDPDGLVLGYLLAIVPDLTAIPSTDTLTYTYVTTTDSVINYPLRQQKKTFLVAVRAVDNSFTYPLPVGAVVKLSPYAYWDKNLDGTFDAGDVRLDGLSSAIDPDGAKQQFPTVNSNPVMGYAYDEADGSIIAQPPDTTFTVASFSWSSTDVDGDETVTAYRIALNDSNFTSYVTVSSSITTMTLAVPRSWSDAASDTVSAQILSGTSPNLKTLGTIPGLKLNARNTLYVKAVDVANGVSEAEKFPTSGHTWYVKKPKSRLLVVEDYINGDTVSVQSFYHDSVFTKAANGRYANYDVINIRRNSTSTRAFGSMVPALQHINPMLIKTFQLYQCVFWYTDGTPSLTVAQKTLYHYMNYSSTSDTIGHVIFSTQFLSPDDPNISGVYTDIAPIDSLSSSYVNIITKSSVMRPDSSVVSAVYPPLNFEASKRTYIFQTYANADAQTLYQVQYAGKNYNCAVMDGNKHMLFIEVPLHYVYPAYPASGGLIQFFTKAFSTFGMRVD